MNFVSIETSKKLKEKGFPCIEVYKQDSAKIFYELPMDDPNWYLCKAWYIPTLSQVLKWLREEKKLHIIIPASFDEGYWWEIRDFSRNISEYSEAEYQSYEDAAIKAVEYCLNNLL